MKTIDKSLLINKIKNACIQINYHADNSLISLIKKFKESEESKLGKHVLTEILENAEISGQGEFPMCQDTGTVVVFLEIGNEVKLDFDIYEAINEGVRQGYNEGYLRKSMVKHPIDRVNTKDNTPAIIHTQITMGKTVKIKLASKGGGSENISMVKILKPSDGIDGIKDFVLSLINEHGGKACPPLTIGIGIGGNLEKSALLAKEALFRDIDDISDDPIAAKLEKELLEEINKLGVGPMGFGGSTTCIAVKINFYPCHIASLPVAINVQCHSARHTEVIL